MTRIKPTQNNLSILPLQALMYISPFLAGLYHEWSACLAGIYLAGWLLYVHRTRKTLRLPKNISMLALTVIALFYLLSPLWAVDRGMALLGFAKFLPLPLFAIAVRQFDLDRRRELLQTVPLTGVVMTILSLALGQFPAFSDFFLVNSRLAGFFQYPNTFAMFLLAGFILTLSRKQPGWRELLYLAVLLAGIILSGSRTVFILLLAVAAYYLIVSKNRRLRRILLGLLAFFIAATVVYALATGNLSSAARYLTASLSTSTFVGRFLYFRDAIPQILTHPLGLGYMGYHYTLGSFQTGVYSLVHVHNDLLQLMLDVGWLPAILLVWALVKGFFSGRCTAHDRVLLLALCAHALFDFDFQFLSLWFLLILLMDLDAGSCLSWRAAPAPTVLWGVLCAVSLYFGVASGLCFLHAQTAAVRVYPGYTDAWLQLLTEAEDTETMETVADNILKHNESISLAHSAKARAAYSRGDFGAVIAYKTRAITLARYTLAEYLDYFDMLTVGVELYTQAGDTASADVCRQELLSIPDRLAQVLESTSALGRKISDQPALDLPPEYVRQLAEYGNR